MKDSVLIDTSAWIESFKKTGNKSLQQLIIKTLDSSQVATTNIIMLNCCRDAGIKKNWGIRLIQVNTASCTLEPRKHSIC